MIEKSLSQAVRALCINTEKVYDWVIEQSSGSTSIPVGSLPIPLPADATNVEANCILTDATGTPIPINSQVSVTESSPRKDQQFEIGGSTVTLQRVTFTKTLYVVMEVTGIDPATGTRFLIKSDPASFTFIEIAYLCAPPGTSLVVRISDFSCLAIIRRNDDGDITGFVLDIFVCQSIQTVAPVTIEFRARHCEPREALTEKCVAPTIPLQCPTVFPGD